MDGIAYLSEMQAVTAVRRSNGLRRRKKVSATKDYCLSTQAPKLAFV